MTKKTELINLLNELQPVPLRKKRVSHKPFSYAFFKEESEVNDLEQEEYYRFALELGARYWNKQTDPPYRKEAYSVMKEATADFIYRDIKGELYSLLPFLYELEDRRSRELIEKVHGIIDMMEL